MRLKVLPAIGLVLLLLAAGCGEPPSGDSVVKKEVDIRGVVTSVQPADPMGANSDILGSVLIEGEREEDTQFDKANVTVTDKTRIFERSSGALTESTFESLEEGLKVEAWFTGPVAESYPVQATADKIIWEEANEQSGIEHVKEKHEQELLSINGVVGIGIAQPEGEPCIVVYLENDSADLAAEIPGELEGYNVKTEVTGPIEAL